MYTCLIADDNSIERDVLIMHISKIKSLKIIAACSNGIEAAEILQAQQIDIVFSDIDMPELSGIGLIKSIQKPPVFIFVSSYPEYAAESFNLDVVDYIVKPASFDRVLKAANKAIEYLNLKKNLITSGRTDKVSTVSNDIGRNIDPDEYFFIKDNNGYTKLKVSEVLYIESMGDFSKIFTLLNKSYVVLVSLKSIEKQVSNNVFRRVHKQYIVNLMHICSVTAIDILLAGKQIVPLSNSYKQQLQETIIDKNLLKRFGE